MEMFLTGDEHPPVLSVAMESAINNADMKESINEGGLQIVFGIHGFE